MKFNFPTYLVLFFICYFAADIAFAQNPAPDKPLLSVKSFQYDMTDMTANLKGSTVYDQNGDKCALIKVITTETGFYFSCGMMSPVKVEQKVGEVWVYVPYGIKHLKIQHPKLGTTDYPISIQIEKAKTYVMELTSANVMVIVAPVITQQWVIFNVEPKDALVELDGIALETSDGRAKQFVNFGEYSYSVSARQYHSATGSVKVNDAGSRVEVNVKLTPAFGTLNLSPLDNLTDASIYLDNNLVSASSIESLRLDSGEHTIKVVKSKYKPYTSTFTIEEGKLITMSPVLEANFNRYTIKSLEGSEIWINGEKVGVSPWSGDLTYGPCTIECKMAGHHSASISMHISPSTPLELTVDNPIPIYGSLNIDSNPDGATVVLDGKKIGETPLLLPNVIIGDHKLTLSRNGYSELSETITVTEGKVSQTSLKLVPIAGNITEEKVVEAPGQKEQSQKVAKQKFNYLIEASIAVVPQVSYGLMFGMCKKAGWYIKGRTDFSFPQTTYECNSDGYRSNGTVSYDKMWTNGESKKSRIVGTAGMLIKTWKFLYPYVGVGYGSRTVAWQDIDGSWAKVTDYSCSGFSFDLGAIFKMGKFTLSVGMTNTAFKFTELELGIGVMF